MIIKVKFPAQKVVKSYKANANDLLTVYVSYSYSSKLGNGYRFKSGSEEYVLAINWEKHNRKVKSKKKVKKMWNGVQVTTTVRKYEPAYWVSYYYKIPVSFLVATGLKVEQGNKNFKLVKSK